MKRLFFAASLCFCVTVSQAQAKKIPHKDSSDEKLSSANLMQQAATVEKNADKIQNGLNKLKGFSKGRLQKKLGSVSNGVSDIMKAGKTVSDLDGKKGDVK